jgi:exopolyphosphatase/guanosine-5'-triphosphate,3'-diphosphate pyrophosphatase
MPPDRARVLPGGVAILSAIFDRLGIERMSASTGALREGLVYDLLGRIRHEDVRDRTIRSYSERYHVDDEQARRVESTAQHLLEQVASSWDLAGPEPVRLLGWAARLHEIGKAISYNGYHKHSAYIVAHSEMPGFSKSDQEMLAALVMSHRGSVRPSRFESLPLEREESAVRLALLLRLAVLLNRGRSRRAVPMLRVRAKKRTLLVSFPPGWLDENPLTRADFEQEAAAFDEIDYELFSD